MEEKPTLRIGIADDHQVVLEGLKRMLATQEKMLLGGAAANGEELLEMLSKNPVDVVLLDINMPGINGIETCKKLKKDFPEIKVVMLSMLDEISLVRMAIKHGASGYLLKNAGPEEIYEAIRAVHGGKQYYSEEILDGLLNPQSKAAKPAGAFPTLSRREKQVLQLIVDEYTTSEIADRLFISFATVETHRRNLLLKLNARNTAGLVRMALEYDLLNG